ncbi:MAG: M20/M25/M40 family metallo-hydrolase [Thalassotalea sp.]
MKTTKKLSYMAMALALPLSLSNMSLANNISLKQMTFDVTSLASDELKGRGNFTAEIDQAANYISNRFKEIGLTPLAGFSDYKQTFNIVNIRPVSADITLNGNKVLRDNVAMASTIEQFDWKATTEFTTHVVAADGNMRATLGKINQQGGKHLVLINTAHSKMFKGYQGYFARGLNKLSVEHQGAIILVLTDETAINSIDISAKSAIKKQVLTNVVGVLKGTDKDNENVLFSAHYDHLGGHEGQGDTIYNGADDDASGTTAVMNLAQHYAKKGKNSRSLIFAAFTAEEIGGFGSRYFSEQIDPNSITAMINIEMIGKPSKFGPGQVWMTGMERSSLGEILNSYLKDKKGKIYQDPYPEQKLFYRSDNATLARLGVPAHSFSSTQLDKDKHYHKVTDDLASLDLNSMHQVIENLAVATQGLVDGSITPTRIDANKVKGRGKIF